MRAAAWILGALGAGLVVTALAQVPQGTRLSRPTMPLYSATSGGGSRLDCVITGSSTSNADAQSVMVSDFELKSFRDGDAKQIQIIAQAPECQVDISSGLLWNKGHLQVFTPTTNLFVQGFGFLFIQSNHFLTISNQVESRVVKSLLKSSSLLNGGPAQAQPAAPGQVVLINARRGEFRLDSNVVDYFHDVHLIDPQLDMTSDFLTIRFTTNGAVQSMFARQNVVLTTTNNGRATGATGFYFITNGDEMMRLSDHAAWRHGDEQADADEFIYDSTRHFLTGSGHVKARWPNAAPGPPGSTPATAGLEVGTNGFRELYADYATMQFPPTNGPMENMHARGNVLIVNQADHTTAVAEKADYVRATGRLELTGHPVWLATNMEVTADLLAGDLNEKIYHARNNSHFKMRTGNTANQTGGSAKNSTNQWLYIASDDIDYETNKAVFRRNVVAQLKDNGQLKDTLKCDLLTLNLVSNKVESAIARDNVQGETAPDASGLVKTIACDLVNAYCTVATGRLQSIDAHTNVVIVEKGVGPAAPFNTLAADTVTARFSPVTNQLEQAIAEQNVVFDQHKAGGTLHATSDYAIYNAGTNDEVKLTGSPLAHSDHYFITNADFLIWKPKANVFQAAGHYQIFPIKQATNEHARNDN